MKTMTNANRKQPTKPSDLKISDLRLKRRRRRRRKNPDYYEEFGHTKVPFYTRITASGKTGYLVRYFGREWDAKKERWISWRKFLSFSTESEARDAARTLAQRLDDKKETVRNATPDQCEDYAEAMDKLWNASTDFDNPALAWLANENLPDLVKWIVECLCFVGGDKEALREASKQYGKKKPAPKVSIRVEDAVTKYLADKKADGKSDNYIGFIRCRLRQLYKKFHVNLDDISVPELQGWLDGLKLLPPGYMAARMHVSGLYQWAIPKGHAAENLALLTQSKKTSNGDSSPAIFTVDEMRRLLAAADPKFLPGLAIGSFAGVRTTELMKMDWSDIDFTEVEADPQNNIRACSGYIILDPKKTKKRQRRVVPISSNLKAWLTPHAKKSGKIWPHALATFVKAEMETALNTEIKANPKKGIAALPAVEWKKNAMRHSFCSYQLAKIKNAAEVAEDAGNSPAMIRKHYLKVVKPEQAAEWFAIMPPDDSKVVSLPSRSEAVA